MAPATTDTFDVDAPVYEQVQAGAIFITRDGGHIVRLTHVDEDADEIHLTYHSTGETEIFSEDEMADFWETDAYAITRAVLRDPEQIVRDYAWQHFGEDLNVLGRGHEYHVGGSRRVADIEFALWAAAEADRENWPPEDGAGIWVGDD